MSKFTITIEYDIGDRFTLKPLAELKKVTGLTFEPEEYINDIYVIDQVRAIFNFNGTIIYYSLFADKGVTGFEFTGEEIRKFLVSVDSSTLNTERTS